MPCDPPSDTAAPSPTGRAGSAPGRAPLRLAIAGVGNCASALVQGLHTYRDASPQTVAGLMHHRIAGLGPGDLEVVAAFDIDRRKVGRPVGEAVFARPNCCRVFAPDLPADGPTVQMGPVLDGVAAHMADYPEQDAFRVADAPPVDLARALADSGAEVLVSYLPVGAERAVAAYAWACLSAGVALVNCQPVFVASDPAWAARFQAAGLPLVGDDIKSQLGATIVHRMLTRLFADRGVQLDRTYQLNTGGNTDFLNMLERDRLATKKRSKTESVQSQLDVPLDARAVHIGPSDYVAWQEDNKVCFVRMEGQGFGGAPVELELRLSVQDSPNSAGVALDAIRCARLGLDRGLAGPLEAAGAVCMKHPPRQMTDGEAMAALEAFLAESRVESAPAGAGE
jgi:myo-inositol-1-phosphate synthase